MCWKWKLIKFYLWSKTCSGHGWKKKERKYRKHNTNHNNSFNTASYWMGCIDLCNIKDMLTRGRPTGSFAIGKHILHWGTIIIPLRKILTTWHLKMFKSTCKLTCVTGLVWALLKKILLLSVHFSAIFWFHVSLTDI